MTERIPMDPERWARIEAVFHEAAELPEAEQPGFLEGACGSDPALRAAVVRLLATDRTSSGAVLDDSLDALVAPLLSSDSGPAPADLPPGSLVGRYRIVDVLGAGGMGTVYRAERADGTYERHVAVKMVRSGRLGGDAERRFEQERRILGRLKHPGIATLVDGGVTSAGEAFLVMELVEGVAITDYVAREGLGVHDRVRLALQVVDAVEYAHGNLVVHRDLKPSNILVDERGTVRLLDFGIARLIEEEPGDALTRTGLLLLTPDYAAPEQIRGDPVTTATDVYAIGAILYELLSGRRPFGPVTSKWSDLERVLEEPPVPLSRLDGLDPGLRRAVAGDLETIVRKALHKDPERRYPSARALGEDLQRHLDGRPVLARPDSLTYRASRFLRRNRAATAAAAALVAALVLGAAGTLWQAREAREQAARGAAVGDFLFSLFDAADPDLHPGEPVTALELLEAGAAAVDSFAAGPEARVDLLTTLGILFGKLGQNDRAQAVLTQAVDEATRTLSPRDPAVATALDALGMRQSLTGDLDQAERLLTAALEARVRNGAPALDIAATRGNLGAALRNLGRYDEAEVMYLAAIEEVAAATGGDSASFASEMMGLGQVYEFQDRFGEAEALYAAARRLWERGETETPQLAIVIHNLGVVTASQGRLDESVALHGEALAMWRRLFPSGHPEIPRSLEAIARVQARQGEWARADSLYDEAIAAWEEPYGDAYLATIHANQANIRYRMGEFDAAAAAYRQGIRIWRDNGDTRLLGVALSNLGVIERERGDYASADTLLAEALRVRTEIGGEVHTGVAETHGAIAGLRIREGRFGDAERHARTAIEQYDTLLGPEQDVSLAPRLELAVSMAETGRCAEATPLLTAVQERYETILNARDPRLGRARLWLGVCAAEGGDPARARELLESALPSLTAGLRSDAPDLVRARAELSALAG